MGRKRKPDTSSQNPFASPRSGGRAPSRSAAAAGSPWLLAAACLVLLVSTLLAFRPALNKNFGFVNLDDNRYIYENQHVTQGLTGDSIRWAFTSLEYDNWHPLTWLSLMLDRQIFGPESVLEHGRNVWGFHWTSILLHALNVLVLFLALRSMTSALWPSLLVAVLFGLHPLRAESVAWVSERKDVLSGLFFFLTLWAYSAYAKDGRSWLRYGPAFFLFRFVQYGLVIVLFILGLMAKPMLVTLPVLLLLLDYWPLGRLRLSGATREKVGNAADLQPAPGSWTWILLEKVPLVVLALISSVVTMKAQSGAMLVIDTITFPMRLENALVSYATYIGMIFYPVKLAPLYPFPEHGVPWPNLAVSVLALAAITALVASTLIVRRRDWQWLSVGWLWYLATLVPVIGLVQVGVQAMADRYTYLPQIGLYIMFAWTANALTADIPWRGWLWGAALVLLIPVLVQSTAAQTATWKDSETLLTSALKANPNIALAENNLGYIREHEQSRFDEAFERYQHAVEIRPRYVEARINLANAYVHKAQALKPTDPQKFKELTDKAVEHYSAAVEVRPDYDLSYLNRGRARLLRGELPQAEDDFRAVLEINPRHVEARWRLGLVLCQRNEVAEGIDNLRQAVAIEPRFYPALQSLDQVAQSLFNQGRYDEAIPCCEVLLQQPATADEAAKLLGYLYYVKHQPRQALEQWGKFLDKNPDSLPVLTMTAWLLATDPDPSPVRNGGKALTLAQRANKISQGRDSSVLMVLAAATAENGDCAQAAEIMDRANRLPDRPFSNAAMLDVQGRFRSGEPYQDGVRAVLMKPDDRK